MYLQADILFIQNNKSRTEQFQNMRRLLIRWPKPECPQTRNNS